MILGIQRTCRGRSCLRGVAMAGAAAAILGMSAWAEVQLRLRVPEAETYVLGDTIPLVWAFENRGAEPLGFMWEGCCRLNGKLEVRSAGGGLPTVPPGQALAHMFARADRLDPGAPKEYETKVADWVRLPGTGTYELQGTYRGVLPTQFPQVQKGLALWREAAVSSPVRVSVLSVEDYLASRDERARLRGVRVTLAGPSRMPPIGSARFRVAFESRRDEPTTLTWPDEVGLWVLNERSERTAATAVISGVTGPVTVPAGGTAVREFELHSDRWEGEALGSYRLFVDWAAGGVGRPRVPSNLLPVEWRLDPVQVAGLLEAAARGAGTGARNAPLKLLRVYLPDLETVFSKVDVATLTPDAARLAERLSRTARLRRLGGRTGGFDLVLRVPPTGPAQWRDAEVEVAARAPGAPSPSDLSAQVGELLALRRHLGWEMSVVLEPDAATPSGRLRELAGALEAHRSDWAEPVSVRLPTGGTNAAAQLIVRSESGPEAAHAPAGPALRITPAARESTRDGRTYRSADIEDTWVREAAAVESLSPDGIPVRVGGRVLWGRLQAALEPLLRPGRRFLLTLEPTP